MRLSRPRRPGLEPRPDRPSRAWTRRSSRAWSTPGARSADDRRRSSAPRSRSPPIIADQQSALIAHGGEAPARPRSPSAPRPPSTSAPAASLCSRAPRTPPFIVAIVGGRDAVLPGGHGVLRRLGGGLAAADACGLGDHAAFEAPGRRGAGRRRRGLPAGPAGPGRAARRSRRGGRRWPASTARPARRRSPGRRWRASPSASARFSTTSRPRPTCRRPRC